MLLAILFFVLGTIVASFVGVLVVRLNTGQSFFSGRSRCDACDAPLSPLSLVPLLSYAASRARARCCGASLSPLAPATELLLGGLFVISYLKIGAVLALPFLFLALALLLALALYDLSHQILPPPLLTAFVLLAAVTGFFLAPSSEAFYATLVPALLIFASLALIHFLSRGRAMGFADAPLSLGLALLVGPAAFPGFVFSFWIGASVGILVLLRRPVGSRMGVEVPFAPFLVAGFLLAYFTQWNPFILSAVLIGN